VDKAPDAFRTISEVGEDLDLPQHVLRFWETRFPQIKPLKRGGGRRYYRPDDVELLKGIRHLLYGEGYTIKGVQRILKEEGLRYVQTIWAQPATDAVVSAKPPPASAPSSISPQVPPLQIMPAAKANVSEQDRPVTPDPRGRDVDPVGRTDVRVLRYTPDIHAELPQRNDHDEARGGFSEAPMRGLSEPRVGQNMVRESADMAAHQSQGHFPVGEIRSLQAALFELGECRRLLGLAMATDTAEDI
jgi:DNA-binding transcriptional MerR regulator